MIMDQGCNHGSLMWGKWVIIAFSTIIWNDWRFARSTHNTHIEWTWVEVGACFVCQWWAFCLQLEHCHQLDCYNPQHLWFLHHLFLNEIDQDCITCCEEWNSHLISGEGYNQSPNVSSWYLSTHCILYLSSLRTINIIFKVQLCSHHHLHSILKVRYRWWRVGRYMRGQKYLRIKIQLITLMLRQVSNRPWMRWRQLDIYLQSEHVRGRVGQGWLFRDWNHFQ